MVVSCGPSGGTGGDAFDDSEEMFNVPTTLAEVLVRSGDKIDRVQFVHIGPDDTIVGHSAHGGEGGDERSIRVGDGHWISAMFGYYGDSVDALAFELDGDVNRITWFGGRGSWAYFRYTAPPGYEIVGVKGRSGDRIDAIGVVFAERADRDRASSKG